MGDMQMQLNTLWRNVDALGGSADNPFDKGWNEAISSALRELEKCGFIEGNSAAADMLKAQAAEIERLTRERDIAIGERVARSKLALRLRMAFIDICDSLEDEGDRVYFGSTNDADAFREAVTELDAWNWHDILRDERLVDPFKTSREAVKRAEEAEAKVAAMTEALERIATDFIPVNQSQQNLALEEIRECAREAVDAALAGTA